MTKPPKGDAIDAIRTLWNASAIGFLVWLLLLPEAIARLRAYEAAVHLTTWRLLRDACAQLPVAGSGAYLKEGYVVNTPQSGFVGEEPPKSKYPLLGMRCHGASGRGEHCEPIVINTRWPEQREIVVFLSSALLQPPDKLDNSKWEPTEFSKLTHFRVVTSESLLPLDSYIISRLVFGEAEEYRVHNMKDEWTKRLLAVWPTERLVPQSRPLHHSQILTYCGVSNAEAVTDEQLRQFQEFADLSKSTFGVAGLNVNIAFAFAGIGIIFGAFAFLMLGPLSVLKCHRTIAAPSVWTLALGTREKPVFEALIATVWLVWAAAPIAIATTQLLIGVPLPRGYQIVRIAGLLGLAFSAVIFFICVLEVRRMRQRTFVVRRLPT